MSLVLKNCLHWCPPPPLLHNRAPENEYLLWLESWLELFSMFPFVTIRYLILTARDRPRVQSIELD